MEPAPPDRGAPVQPVLTLVATARPPIAKSLQSLADLKRRPMPETTKFFAFEADFVESLRCIPMQVRLKLDTCGIKLKLPQWHRFSPEERQTLVELPCETEADVQAYRALLQSLVLHYTDEPATELSIDPTPPWNSMTAVPESVQVKAQEAGTAIALAQWTALSPEQRFALFKLSRSGHENHNFPRALEEFHLKPC